MQHPSASPTRGTSHPLLLLHNSLSMELCNSREKTSISCSRPIKWLAQIDQQLLNPPNGTVMPLDLALPTTILSILDEFLFNTQTTTQARCVRRSRHKFGAREVEVTLTGTFLWKAQAPAEL